MESVDYDDKVIITDNTATEAKKRKRVEENSIKDAGNQLKRIRQLKDDLDDNCEQQTIAVSKKKRGRPSLKSFSSNNSIRVIHLQPKTCNSRKVLSPSDKKIRKPVYLITEDRPNEYTFPTTDVAFAQKFISVSPFLFRGRKPLSARAYNPEIIIRTDDA